MYRIDFHHVSKRLRFVSNRLASKRLCIKMTELGLFIFNPTFFRALRVPAKSKQYFHWLTFDRQTVVDVSRLHMNEGARRNKQWSSCRRFPSPLPFAFRARPIFRSPFPFLASATQAKEKLIASIQVCK